MFASIRQNIVSQQQREEELKEESAIFDKIITLIRSAQNFLGTKVLRKLKKSVAYP